MTIQVGSSIPSHVVYHLPPKVGEVCVNFPEKIDISKLEHPTLVVVVPGAFTPTCSELHVPGFLTTTAISFLKDADIKNVYILSTDSPFVTRAWGDSLASDRPEIADEINSGYIKFVSDAGGDWLKLCGLVGEPTDLFAKSGLRGLRSAIIINKSGHVQYLGIDKAKGSVEKSGIQGVLTALKSFV